MAMGDGVWLWPCAAKVLGAGLQQQAEAAWHQSRRGTGFDLCASASVSVLRHALVLAVMGHIHMQGGGGGTDSSFLGDGDRVFYPPQRWRRESGLAPEGHQREYLAKSAWMETKLVQIF